MDAPSATFVDFYLTHSGYPLSSRNQVRVLEASMLYPKYARIAEDRIAFLDRTMRNVGHHGLLH